MQEGIEQVHITKKVNKVHMLIDTAEMIYWSAGTKFHLRQNLF